MSLSMGEEAKRLESDAPVSRMAAHHRAIGRGWALWRSVCLRGAGFPVHHVTALAASECARRVDGLLQVEDDCEERRQAALVACEEGNRLGMEGSGPHLTRARKQLRQGLVPETAGATTGVKNAIDAFARARAAAETERAKAADAFAASVPVTGAKLKEAARDPALRKAMLWQNRGVVKGTVDALVRRPIDAVDSKTREYARLMASYLQRYCVKNDTIGFFGPVGWGTIVDQGPALVLRPGPMLLARRTVYFENWGVQLLAELLSNDPELRGRIPPRRSPTVRLDGTMLFHGLGRRTELPVEYARIVEACDGELTPAEIAARVCADRWLGLSGPGEVWELIEQLVEKRVLSWSLEIPTAVAHPERALRRLLERISPCEAKERALSSIEELEAARDSIARSCDDETSLDESLARLDADFERISGSAACRRAGQAYAGRTLVFEDCVRDAELELGPPLLARLAPPLLLLLKSARWYTFEIARRFEGALVALFASMTRESGSKTLDFVQFLAEANALFSGSQYQPSPIVEEVIQDLRARWSSVLALEPGERRALRTVHSLGPRVDALFAAPHPGWPGARYQSPDVMIAAASAEAIARGDFSFVLGELHTGDNTASNPVFVHQHPEPAELVRAVEQDMPEARIWPVVPKERSTRADQLSLCRHDFDVELGATRSSRPREQVLAAGDLVIDDVGGSLHVRTRDRRLSFHVLAFFEHYLKLESIGHFKLLAPAPHLPRVTIGDLVVAREAWRFEPAALSFASESDPFARFVAARRWKERHGLPRHVFVKIPEEIKPCFVDFESPVYIEILAKLARRASSLTASEMLPELDDAWLADRSGQRYTSELRIVAVDPEKWRAS